MAIEKKKPNQFALAFPYQAFFNRAGRVRLGQSTNITRPAALAGAVVEKKGAGRRETAGEEEECVTVQSRKPELAKAKSSITSFSPTPDISLPVSERGVSPFTR